MIDCNNLTKRYRKHIALNNISFKVREKCVLGLIGANGSGKTTLLNIISGLIKNYKGELNIAKSLKIGIMTDAPYFYSHLTSHENLELVCRLKNTSTDIINRVIQQVDLSASKKQKFGSLSYGMKQRLALASVLIDDPDLLLFDEPTNGLDPEGIILIRQIIRLLNEKGKTIIISSHNLTEIELTCSDVICLKNGGISYHGPIEPILREKKGLEFFFNETIENYEKNAKY